MSDELIKITPKPLVVTVRAINSSRIITVPVVLCDMYNIAKKERIAIDIYLYKDKVKR